MDTENQNGNPEKMEVSENSEQQQPPPSQQEITTQTEQVVETPKVITNVWVPISKKAYTKASPSVTVGSRASANATSLMVEQKLHRRSNSSDSFIVGSNNNNNNNSNDNNNNNKIELNISMPSDKLHYLIKSSPTTTVTTPVNDTTTTQPQPQPQPQQQPPPLPILPEKKPEENQKKPNHQSNSKAGNSVQSSSSVSASPIPNSSHTKNAFNSPARRRLSHVLLSYQSDSSEDDSSDEEGPIIWKKGEGRSYESLNRRINLGFKVENEGNNNDNDNNSENSNTDSSNSNINVNANNNNEGSEQENNNNNNNNNPLPPIVKKKTQRDYLAQEILTTERKYINNLNRIITLFLLPLRNPLNLGKGKKKRILTEEEANSIFGNIEIIFNIHKIWLPEFEERLSDWNDQSRIGDIFVRMAPFLKSYTKYTNSYNASMQKLNDLSSNNPHFQSFLEKTLSKPASKGLNISAYLIMPIQRIPRYRLLLEQIVKHTSEDHPDMGDLKAGLREICEAADYIDQQVKHFENLHRVLDIQNSFVGPHEKLVAPCRILLREAELIKISDRVVNVRHFFLFNDLLVYAVRAMSLGSTKVNKFSRMFKFRESVLLETAWVKDLPDTKTFQNLFQITTTTKTYFLCAPTPEVKRDWMTDLNQIISKMENKPGVSGEKSTKAYEVRGSISVSEVLKSLDTIHSSPTTHAHTSLANRDKDRDRDTDDEKDKKNKRKPKMKMDKGEKGEKGDKGEKGSSDEEGVNVEDFKAEQRQVVWLKDQISKCCMECSVEFTLITRRSHCRRCGRVLCTSCCLLRDFSHFEPNLKKIKLCDRCFEEITVQIEEMQMRNINQ